MIQRIQTIYFLVAVFILVYFAAGAPISSYEGNDIMYLLKSNQLVAQTASQEEAEVNPKYFFIGSILLILWTVYVIISFRNLKRQLLVARVGSLVYLAYLLIILLTYFIGTSLTENETVAAHPARYQSGTYLLIIGYILYQFGIYGIKKDKNKIESVDRIR